MKQVMAVILLAALAAGCGSSTSNPVGPSGTTASAMTGAWAGSSLDSSSSMGGGSMMGQQGLGAMTWQLTQAGTAVTGTLGFSGMHGGRPGSFSGIMSGDAMTMTMDLPAESMMSSGCVARATGTAHLNRTTMTITGAYAGSNSCSGAFTDGHMTMTRR